MYQVIIKDRFSCSIHLGQYFFTDRGEAENFKEQIENNYLNVEPELIDVELMDLITALHVAGETLRKRHEHE